MLFLNEQIDFTFLTKMIDTKTNISIVYSVVCLQY